MGCLIEEMVLVENCRLSHHLLQLVALLRYFQLELGVQHLGHSLLLRHWLLIILLLR